MSDFNQPSAGDRWRIERRDFLKISAWALTGLFGGCAAATAPRTLRASVRFGLITDTHYADAPPRGKRFYRESVGKVREAVGRLRSDRAEFLAVLGDMKDMATGENDAATLSHLVAIEREFQGFKGPLYHVLGNHDMDNLSKRQVLAHIENTGVSAGQSYYGFSRGGLRFITLDATYDEDGRDYDHGNFNWKDANIPAPELEWLRRELAGAREPVIVFVHQRLDGDGPASIRNRLEVRRQLETSGKVLAVFQGHDHPGFHNQINGIHYYTLRAVVEGSGPENNSYAVVDVSPDLDISVTGYRRALGMKWPHASAVPTV